MDPAQPARRLKRRRIVLRKRKLIRETAAKSDQSGSPTQRNWSELSSETLLTIGKHLNSRIHVTRFRSVCKNWRSSLPLPRNPNILNPKLPLQLRIPDPNPLPFTEPFHKTLNLVATTVFLVQPLDHQNPSNSNSDSGSKSKGWVLCVEESKPGKLKIMYPVSKDPVKYMDPSFPKFLDINEFRVSEIGKGFLLGVSDLHHVEYLYSACKVVLCCLNSAENSTADDCTAVVLYTDGSLIGLRLGGENWGYMQQSLVSRFMDILWLGGVLYAVDDGGRLYVVDHVTLQVTETIVNHPVAIGLSPIRLVNSLGEIFLVAIFSKKIYRLNRIQQKWKVLVSLGNKTVCLGFDGSFVVPTQRLLGHGGDFMIFNKSIVDEYGLDNLGFKQAANDIGALMYNLTSSMDPQQVDESYQAISSSLWPPPTWFWHDAYAIPSNKDDTGIDQQLSVHSHWPLITAPPQIDNLLQNVESCTSIAAKVKFEGVDIRPDLVSILQKIWAKHGNVLEGSSVHSKDMLKGALKSLAKAVTILQSSTGRTLTQSQCDEVTSILMELKCLRLRVEWLEPFVERAVTLHQSKPMVDILEDLETNIDKAKQLKMEFLKELAILEQVERKLHADKTIVSSKIPFEEHVLFYQCIGDGLL